MGVASRLPPQRLVVAALTSMAVCMLLGPLPPQRRRRFLVTQSTQRRNGCGISIHEAREGAERRRMGRETYHHARNNDTIPLLLRQKISKECCCLRGGGSGRSNGSCFQDDDLLSRKGTDTSPSVSQGRMMTPVEDYHEKWGQLDSDADEDVPAGLAEAVESGNIKEISCKLQRGADPLEEGRSGWPAFHLACNLGDLDALELFSRYTNAFKDIVNRPLRKGRYTPLSLACQKGHHKAAEFLLEHNASHLKCMAYLLHYGADPNRVCQSHGTPVYIAARLLKRKALDLLVNYGGNLSVTASDTGLSASDILFKRYNLTFDHVFPDIFTRAKAKAFMQAVEAEQHRPEPLAPSGPLPWLDGGNGGNKGNHISNDSAVDNSVNKGFSPAPFADQSSESPFTDDAEDTARAAAKGYHYPSTGNDENHVVREQNTSSQRDLKSSYLGEEEGGGGDGWTSRTTATTVSSDEGGDLSQSGVASVGSDDVDSSFDREYEDYLNSPRGLPPIAATGLMGDSEMNFAKLRIDDSGDSPNDPQNEAKQN